MSYTPAPRCEFCNKFVKRAEIDAHRESCPKRGASPPAKATPPSPTPKPDDARVDPAPPPSGERDSWDAW